MDNGGNTFVDEAMNMNRIIESARLNLAWYTEACFEAWMEGDVLSVHRYWRGAQRCAHVIRLAEAMSANEPTKIAA